MLSLYTCVKLHVFKRHSCEVIIHFHFTALTYIITDYLQYSFSVKMVVT